MWGAAARSRTRTGTGTGATVAATIRGIGIGPGQEMIDQLYRSLPYYVHTQSSPQEYLSVGCTLAKVLSNYIKYRISALLHSVSGGKTSLCGGKNG